MDNDRVSAALLAMLTDLGRLVTALEHDAVLTAAIAVARADPQFRMDLGIATHKLAAIVKAARGPEDAAVAT